MRSADFCLKPSPICIIHKQPMNWETSVFTSVDFRLISTSDPHNLSVSTASKEEQQNCRRAVAAFMLMHHSGSCSTENSVKSPVDPNLVSCIFILRSSVPGPRLFLFLCAMVFSWRSRWRNLSLRRHGPCCLFNSQTELITLDSWGLLTCLSDRLLACHPRRLPVRLSDER